MTGSVRLREIEDGDLPVFLEKCGFVCCGEGVIEDLPEPIEEFIFRLTAPAADRAR